MKNESVINFPSNVQPTPCEAASRTTWENTPHGRVKKVVIISPQLMLVVKERQIAKTMAWNHMLRMRRSI